MSSEKSLALKISEIEERLENKSVYSETKRTLNRNFGSVTVPSGESRLALKFFAEQSGPVALDLFLNAGAERSCEMSLVADDAVLERMCPSIKYSERARKNFYGAAGEHTLEICFVNREAAFSLFSASAALTGSLAADASPAAAFCVSGGGEYYAVSDDGAVRIFDATLGELKSFSVKADRIALSDAGAPVLFYVYDGKILCRSVFGQTQAATLALNAADFAYMRISASAGAIYFIRDKKLFRTIINFSNGEATASQETAVDASFSDKATRVRVPTDENGDSVLVVQGQSGLYVNGARLRLSGLTDAVFESGVIKLLLEENGLASVAYVDGASLRLTEKQKVCFCDAACFAGGSSLLVVRDKAVGTENF